MVRSGSQRVTNIPLTSIKSGAGILDLIALPLPVYLVIRTFRWVGKHWYVFGLLFLAFFFRWYHVVLLLLTVPLVYLTVCRLLPGVHNWQTTLLMAYRSIQVRRKWQGVLATAKLDDGPKPPQPLRIRGWVRNPPRMFDSSGKTLSLSLDLSGVNTSVNGLDSPERRQAIADALLCTRVRVRSSTPGRGDLILEWEKSPFNSFVQRSSIDLIPDVQTQIPTLDIDDVPVILDVSTLIVGKSGSGKSNLTWNIVRELTTQAVPWDSRVLDPKRVELDALRESPHVIQYCDGSGTSGEWERAIAAFHRDMFSTLEEMKRLGIRSAPISKDFPLHILLIDELLLIPGISTMGADSPLGNILAVGRGANYVVIASTQLPQVDTVGRLRDLFSQRICMATSSAEMTTAALGPQAEARGARCSEITERGVGYIYTDFHGGFRRFRPPYVSDAEVKRIAST